MFCTLAPFWSVALIIKLWDFRKSISINKNACKQTITMVVVSLGQDNSMDGNILPN